VRSPVTRRLGPRVLSALLLFGSRPGRGELIEVKQPVGGMECPECSRGLRLALRDLDGVDALATSWNRRLLTTHFRPASRATLQEIRTMVRARHFTPGAAEIIVAGSLGWRGKQLVVTVSGSGVVYAIRDGAARVAALSPLPLAQAVVVKGQVPAAAPGGGSEDPLVILVAEITPRGGPLNLISGK
jgi:hypothetical protein